MGWFFTWCAKIFLAHFLIKCLAKFLWGLYVHFGGMFTVKSRLQKYGNWAVITGCTRGLGLELSRQLASLGFNLILIARKQEQLAVLMLELKTMHKVEIECVVADFSDGTPQLYDMLRSAFKGREIGMLFNNAGVMYNYPKEFEIVKEGFLWDLINVNMAQVSMLSHMVLKECMIPRRKGLIVNFSSGVSIQPTPLTSAYGATKAYVDYLSRSLYAEYEHKYSRDGGPGILVQSLIPFFIATDMVGYSDVLSKPNLISPSGQTYVRHALWTLGMCHRTTGYFPHTVEQWLLEGVDEFAYRFGARKFLSLLNERALNKTE